MKQIVITILLLIPFFVISQEVYDEVEEMPKYAGCEDAVFPKCTLPSVSDYISSKLIYPRMAVENGVEGTALIKFIIESDGKITGVNLVEGPGDGCGSEALRVIEEMASEIKWIPGKKDGKAVAVRFTLPIQFKL